MSATPPVVRHFLVCLGMEYDWNQPIAPYCLRNVVFGVRPPAGTTYPLTVRELWLFVYSDGVGRQEFWVDLVALSDDTDDEELVASYGPFAVWFGPEQRGMPRGWHIRGVPFPTPGWYEFRLLHDDVVLWKEPLYLEE